MTLSKSDVAQLKTTIDTFAGSYTSGADAAKDKAAMAALQTGLQTLFAGIWSEAHVVSKDSLTKLQQSVDSFVASYTGGTNVAQDTSAWTALKSGLQDFWASTNGAISAKNPPPLSLPPVVLPIETKPVTGNLPFGTGIGELTLGQTPLSKDDVTKLQQAVDTFAAAYTSGTDPVQDKAAVAELESSLSGLAQDWQTQMPMPLHPTPAAPPVSPAGPSPISLPPGAFVASPFGNWGDGLSRSLGGPVSLGR
jgi:hypothetical protein